MIGRLQQCFHKKLQYPWKVVKVSIVGGEVKLRPLRETHSLNTEETEWSASLINPPTLDKHKFHRACRVTFRNARKS